jgi:aminoglycoside phosphotransferase (APT) family kinase protein
VKKILGSVSGERMSLGGLDIIVAKLRDAGLLPHGIEPVLEPLAGGVASDIWRVDGGERTFVVKRALAKLRVTADWQVPVSRNACEVAWMKAAAAVLPANVPEVLMHDPEHGFFAMTYLEPEQHPVWKFELRDGRADPDFAAEVGDIMARLHAATVSVDPAKFNSDSVFHAIRLEPYLEATARKHPEIKPQLDHLVAATLSNHVALVHGDVSPKNILCGPNGPVFLDAECAWFGDPAFDAAFCLNHLLLKCLWTPSATGKFLACFEALAEAYLRRVTWEPREDVERRITNLLPALLLARIDGKSPVEYVTEETQKQVVRNFSHPLLSKPTETLSTMSSLWKKSLIETQ